MIRKLQLQKIQSRDLNFPITNHLQLRRSSDRKIFIRCDFPERKILRIDENTETVVLKAPVESFVPLNNEEFFILENKGTLVTYWSESSKKLEILRFKEKKSFDFGLLLLALLLTFFSTIAIFDMYITMYFPIPSPYREIVTLLVISASILALIKSYRTIEYGIIAGDKLKGNFYLSKDSNVLILPLDKIVAKEKELDSHVIFLNAFEDNSEVKVLARTVKSLYLLNADLEILWHLPVKSDRWAPEVRFIKQDDPKKISDLILTDGENLFILDLNGYVKQQISIQTSPIKKVITIDTGDIDGDGVEEIIVSDSSKIQVIKNKKIIATYDFPRYVTVQMAVADLDNDQIDEIVVCYDYCLEILKSV